MKNFLLLLICIYCLSCTQKPSEIDQKLLNEQDEFYHYLEKSQNILIKRMYNNVENRGNQVWEKALFENVWKQHQLFLRITENFSNKDSLQFLFHLYQQQAEKTNIVWVKFSKTVDYNIEEHQNLFNDMMKNASFQDVELFRNSFYKNHNTILEKCLSWTQSTCCFCFSSPKLNLNSKEYIHGDTIQGKILFKYNQSRKPLLAKININEKAVEKHKYMDVFEYSNIIDSTQKPIVNINVSYLKTVQKDTTFKIQVNYKIK